MWPWEHLALGYLLYSPAVRLSGDRSPRAVEALVLAFATQLPDLIDKPLGWGLGVLPSGLSLGHSLFFALPLVGVVAVLARRANLGYSGVAFSIGYLSHLLGDVVYNSLDGVVAIGFLFWPLVSRQSRDAPSLLFRVARLWSEFRAFLATPSGRIYLLLEVVLLVLALALWVADGTPGLPDDQA